MTKTSDEPGDSALKANPTGETSIYQSRMLELRYWSTQLLTALLARGQSGPPAVLAKQRFSLLDETHA